MPFTEVPISSRTSCDDNPSETVIFTVSPSLVTLRLFPSKLKVSTDFCVPKSTPSSRIVSPVAISTLVLITILESKSVTVAVPEMSPCRITSKSDTDTSILAVSLLYSVLIPSVEFPVNILPTTV